MERKDNMPIWVFLAFSAIETRKGAIRLLAASLLFTLYCFPYVLFFDDPVVETLLIIDTWDYPVMMVSIDLWYMASLMWMDQNDGWAASSNPE